MRIGLVVDNPKRDLHGLVLLGRHLALAGHRVFLIPMYTQTAEVCLLGLDRVVVNYVRRNNLDVLRAYSDMGVGIYVLDTEGGVLSEEGADAPENWAQAMRDLGLPDVVDGYFFWGRRVRDAFARFSGLPESALHLTGSPRYDLCHPRWHGVFSNRDTGYILVNTNFSAINPLFGSSAEGEREVFVRLGWDRDYIEVLFRDLEALFPRYLNAVESLAGRLEDRRFILRPHPFEAPETYRRRFAHLANVEVRPEGNVLEAIGGSDAMVHLNCGSAIETLMSERLPVSLEFLNTEVMRSHAALPSQLSYPARDLNDAEAALRCPAETLWAMNSEALLDEHVVPWFHEPDGRAGERVAEILASGGKAYRSQRAAHLGSRVRSLKMRQRALVVGGLVLGSHAVEGVRSVLRPARREKGVVPATVSDIVSRIEDIAPAGARVSVRRARSPLTSAPLAALEMRADD